jgi:hypothetical protein
MITTETTLIIPMETCPDCDGKGGGYRPTRFDDGLWDCERCEGTGEVPAEVFTCPECGTPSLFDNDSTCERCEKRAQI